MLTSSAYKQNAKQDLSTCTYVTDGTNEELLTFISEVALRLARRGAGRFTRHGGNHA